MKTTNIAITGTIRNLTREQFNIYMGNVTTILYNCGVIPTYYANKDNFLGYWVKEFGKEFGVQVITVSDPSVLPTAMLMNQGKRVSSILFTNSKDIADIRSLSVIRKCKETKTTLTIFDTMTLTDMTNTHAPQFRSMLSRMPEKKDDWADRGCEFASYMYRYEQRFPNDTAEIRMGVHADG